MGESLDRGHVMIFSLWDDVEVNMLWLDAAYPLDKPESDPGIKRGDCPGGDTSTPTYLRDTYPNGGVVFKNAAVGEIGSTYDLPPTSPPVFAEGCYSKDNKNCLPNGYSPEDDSCGTVWLPDGALSNCAALWEECTGQADSCCGDTVCFGNNDYATCVPTDDNFPTPAPTKNPTITPPQCTVCTDTPTKGMIKNNKTCPSVPSALNKKCNKNANWAKKNFCQLSCYNVGNGYPGDVCCNASE